MSEETIDPYHGLNRLDPTEWLNIPRPIVETLTVFKEISIEHANKLQDLASTMFSQQSLVNENIKYINSDLRTIKATITKYQEENMIKMEELNVGILGEVSKFKSNLLIDLDYKQKTSSLPTILEIENKIKDACGDLRVKLKAEIKDSMLMPEIRGLSYDIRDSTQ